MRIQPILLRLGLVLLVVGGGFLGYQSYEEHKQNAKIQEEIDKLQAEAEKIRRENETLAQRIEYFASPDFQEQEAKKKLGMRRQEEGVAAIREGTHLSNKLESVSVSTETRVLGEEVTLPNYQKWWHQFFGQK